MAAKAKETVAILKQVCIEQGLFHAEVWYRLSDVDPDDNTIKVYFIIDEGEAIPIAKINILGTQRLDPDTLSEILKQKESGATADEAFQESKFEEDKFRILGLCQITRSIGRPNGPRADRL